MTGLLRIVDLGAARRCTRARRRPAGQGDNRAMLAESGTAADPPVGRLAEPAARTRPSRPTTPRTPARRSSRRSTRRSPRPTRTGCASSCCSTASPLWANGTDELGAVRGTDAEISFAYADRIAPAAWARYVASGPRPGGVHAVAARARVRRPGRGLRAGHRVGADVRVPPRALPARPDGRAVRRRDRARQRAQLPALAAARAVADRRPVRARRRSSCSAPSPQMMASARAVSAAAGHPSCISRPRSPTATRAAAP